MKKSAIFFLVCYGLSNNVFAAENDLIASKPGKTFAWENKKFSIGLEGIAGIGIETLDPSRFDTFSEIGIITNSPLLGMTLDLIQINLRLWLNQNIHMSLHGSLQTPLYVPIILNIGYGIQKNNFYWYIEGGGGIKMLLPLPGGFLNPVIDIGSGAEWLVSETYSIGFKVKAGTYFSANLISGFVDLSLTANLNY